MMEDMEKLYVYVDESGQDTEGVYFVVVAVVLLEGSVSVSELEKTLERIERETRKGKSKWRPTKFRVRTAYLSHLLQIPQLERTLFYMSFRETNDYTELTAVTIAQAILKRVSGDYQAYIMVDGLKDKDKPRISKTLQRRGIRRRKLRGGKEQNSALLRLADAMAGFIRDYEEGQPYTQDLYRRFVNQRIVTKLEA